MPSEDKAVVTFKVSTHVKEVLRKYAEARGKTLSYVMSAYTTALAEAIAAGSIKLPKGVPGKLKEELLLKTVEYHIREIKRYEKLLTNYIKAVTKPGDVPRTEGWNKRWGRIQLLIQQGLANEKTILYFYSKIIQHKKEVDRIVEKLADQQKLEEAKREIDRTTNKLKQLHGEYLTTYGHIQP